MAKTKTPFLSLGAHGSVAGSITAQKRPASTMLREKPFPTDPYSLPQAYQRWLYQDYSYLWLQQSIAVKAQYDAAGVRFHLTGFQYWMKYHLKKLPDIVAMWHLDEKAGVIAHDSSRTSNHATIFGASPAGGLIDGAQLFDGLNDYIATPGNLINAPLGSSPRTIEGFFRNDDISAIRYLFGYGIYAEGNFCALIYHPLIADKGLLFGGHTFNWASKLLMTQEAWHYCCLQVIDSTHVLIQLDDTEASGVTPGPLNTLPGKAYIGTRLNIESWWKGHADHLIIWDRLLDKTERDRHSARRYGLPPIAPLAPPVPFDYGMPALNRASFIENGMTVLDLNNPADGSNNIDTIKLYIEAGVAGVGVRVGSFYLVAGTTYKCRDSVLLGGLPTGLNIIGDLSINTQLGDFPGWYCTAGKLSRDVVGYAGIAYVGGEHIDPGDEANYNVAANDDCLSLYGSGVG